MVQVLMVNDIAPPLWDVLDVFSCYNFDSYREGEWVFASVCAASVAPAHNRGWGNIEMTYQLWLYMIHRRMFTRVRKNAKCATSAASYGGRLLSCPPTKSSRNDAPSEKLKKAKIFRIRQFWKWKVEWTLHSGHSSIAWSYFTYDLFKGFFCCQSLLLIFVHLITGDGVRHSLSFRSLFQNCLGFQRFMLLLLFYFNLSLGTVLR